jgi:hypothetical protein
VFRVELDEREATSSLTPYDAPPSSSGEIAHAAEAASRGAVAETSASKSGSASSPLAGGSPVGTGSALPAGGLTAGREPQLFNRAQPRLPRAMGLFGVAGSSSGRAPRA